MGTESPDTERMHRLLGDALEDVELTADVVPAVLTGYEQRVKVRRYQAAGVVLAVLATAGAAATALPRGGTGREPVAGPQVFQGPDYCKHQHWAESPDTDTDVADHMSQNPSAEQANCEALQSALRSVFPEARLMPDFTAELAFDPRVDHAQVKKIEAEARNKSDSYFSDLAKYFGSELKYLALHPEDPANVYLPGRYTLITAGGREQITLGLETGPPGYGAPELGVLAIDSLDCGKMPSELAGKMQCTPVGTANAWHGTLWKTIEDPWNPWRAVAIVTDRRDQRLEVSGRAYDEEAWYEDGAYTTGIPAGPGPLKMPTWINRWTGQTSQSWAPPASHALTQQQWARFLDSPALAEYADSYLGYVKKVPRSEGTEAPRSTPSQSPSQSHSQSPGQSLSQSLTH